MRAGVELAGGISDTNFFSAVLSLLHKVLKLKGGVRNVSMQLQMSLNATTINC